MPPGSTDPNKHFDTPFLNQIIGAVTKYRILLSMRGTLFETANPETPVRRTQILIEEPTEYPI
jgi:hypothetical protein